MRLSFPLRHTLVLLPLALCAPNLSAAEDESHWWNGFTISPGIGARHLGLDVTRKSDGANGNISQAGAAQLFAAFSVTTPEYPLGDSHWGLALRMYSSFVTLDHQWYDYHSTDTTTGTSQGERVNVGTKVSGYYTYIIPSLDYRLGGLLFALGVGPWSANLDGDIILTQDKRPAKGMPTSNVSFSTQNAIAYMVTLSYTSSNAWLIEMTVGGTQFSDSTYRYQMEEVAITVGKTFTL